jgi:hypothetical protein
VAARLPSRIGRLVVVDGFVAELGESAIELLPDRAARHYRESSAVDGEGWWIPPRPLANLGVTDVEAMRWLARRLTPHPLKTYLDPVTHGATGVAVPAAYLLCAGWATPFGPMADRARELGWTVEAIAADHEVLATAPDLLVNRLLALAAASDDRLLSHSEHPAEV